MLMDKPQQTKPMAVWLSTRNSVNTKNKRPRKSAEDRGLQALPFVRSSYNFGRGPGGGTLSIHMQKGPDNEVRAQIWRIPC